MCPGGTAQHGRSPDWKLWLPLGLSGFLCKEDCHYRDRAEGSAVRKARPTRPHLQPAVAAVLGPTGPAAQPALRPAVPNSQCRLVNQRA